MSDLEQIHAQLADIRAAVARTEETVKGVLVEALKTNGRMTKAEDWQATHDLAEASQEGLRQGRAEAFVTKKQMTVAVGSISAIVGAITTAVTLIVRYL